jgi:hypothetical protein
MADVKTPSQFLISLLELDTVDDCTKILIVREHKDGGISYDTNTNSRMDAHCLAELCAVWTQADIIKQSVKEG